MRRKLAGPIGVWLLAAAALMAADFWDEKDFTTWSDTEVQEMLTDSPWAKQVRIIVSGRGGEPLDAVRTEVTFTWNSALPIKQALVRQAIGLDAPIPPESQHALERTEPFYAVTLSGLPPTLRWLATRRDALKAESMLARKGKAPIAPTSVRLFQETQSRLISIFTFRTLTPLERPRQFEELETLSAEDAAAFEASERRRRNRDLFDPEKGALFYQPRSEGGVLSYNEFWYERGVELTSDKRTSLVIDPPDGRRPPRVARTGTGGREQAAYRREHMYDSYENRSSADRCLMGFNSGPPMSSATYNNNVMIFQSAGYVAILNEMVHNARLIPIDAGDETERPPFPQYSGVSRGHWEGETLVIETAQFRGGSSGLSSTNMHLVERLTRLDPDTVAYEYTVTDPTVYTAPYTVMLPFRRTDGPLFEYACHEGNIGLHGILAGARVQEARGIPLRP